jgi:hypothetical protein
MFILERKKYPVLYAVGNCHKKALYATVHLLLYVFMACIIKHRDNSVYEIKAKEIVSVMKTLEGSIPTIVSLYMFFRYRCVA